MTKFYEFSQNNSGGSFVKNENIAENVLIEAISAEEANKKAESIGIYFDGVEDDIDCGCCGDRWLRASEGDALCAENLNQYAEKIKKINKVHKINKTIHVHFVDGTKTKTGEENV